MAYYGPAPTPAWNRGPLTTTFTPPSTCLATTSVRVLGYALPSSAQASSYYIGLWPPALYDYLVDTTSNPCIPPGPTPVPLYQPFYYSPGICPSSYTPAIPLAVQKPSVSAWLCCPSGYTPTPELTNALFTTTFDCASTAPGSATLTNIWVAPHGDSPTDTAWPSAVPIGAVTPSAVLTKPTVMALGIPVLWESTDSEVVSWFNSYESSSGLVTTASHSSHSTISASGPVTTTTTSTPGTGTATSSSTNATNATTTKSSGAASSSAGVRLSVVLLGVFVLGAGFIL